MGHELRHIFQVETRKLLWSIGLVFTIILAVQYLELPYGNILSSLFSANKASSPGSLQKGDFPGELEKFGNFTHIIAFNVSDANVLPATNTTMQSVGKYKSPTLSIPARNESSADSPNSDEDIDPEEEPVSKDIMKPYGNSTLVNVEGYNKSSTGNNKEYGHALSPDDDTSSKNMSGNSDLKKDNIYAPQRNERLNTSDFTHSPPKQAKETHPFSSETNVGTKSDPTPIESNPNTSQSDKDAGSVAHKIKNLGPSPVDNESSRNKSYVVNTPVVKDRTKKSVLSLADMNGMLIESHASFRSPKPRWSSSVDQELLDAKSLIETAPLIGNDDNLYAPLYRNLSTFKRSYELMEQTLKVYIYSEGARPIFHLPVLKGIYASEGWFMKLLKANRQFVTKNSRIAHLFYLPFSSRMLEETLYVPNSHSRRNLVQYLKDYVGTISMKYPFWNRTSGSDHFLVACHDWAPSETNVIMAKCIRALCNADTNEGFTFGKDASLPETYVRNPQRVLRELGGKRPSQRQILAFFAGNMHGYVRPILLEHWENKDPAMKIFGVMRKVKGQMNYVQHMKSSKYCICAKGYEVNSPRVVEAIFYECVPVIISDNFVPPFFEVLNWESFAVFISEKDIPNLKSILQSISKKRYLEMYKRVKLVQRHFLWHYKPVKYDIFHMILHSIWHNRVLHVNPR